MLLSDTGVSVTSGVEVTYTVRLHCGIELERLRRLRGQTGAFERWTAFEYTGQDANTQNMHICGSYVDGKVQDSFMEYSSMISDASDPSLSAVVSQSLCITKAPYSRRKDTRC